MMCRAHNPSAPPQARNVPFRCLRQFNDDAQHLLVSAGRSRTIVKRLVAHYFDSDRMHDRLVRELASRDALAFKEIVEAIEVFDYVRGRMRAPHVADLCCSHGLVGILFALFERKVERVTLVDKARPPSFDRVLESAMSVGPWVADKVTYHASRVNAAVDLLDPGVSIVATHACGTLTDRCIDLAISLRSPIAVMPCCYHVKDSRAPEVLNQQLGFRKAMDVDRTYRLVNAGYQVCWGAIPEAVTPMNRIIVGTLGDEGE